VELALSGHDHEEAATQIDGSLVASTASTPSDRTRGRRPSVFNLIRIDGSRIQIEHHSWEPGVAQFRQGTISAFARNRAAQSRV
jgi:hypothetical protein